MIEFRNVDASPVHPKLQDPGATLITFNVRDVDAVAARAEKSGVQMITPGGKPATLEGGKARAIFVKDPTGFYVEVVQRNEPVPPNAPPGNVIGARLAITVKDTDETLRFYRDIFGMEPQSGSFMADKAFTDAAGVPAAAQYRKSTALITSSNLYMDFYEYRGVERTPMKAVIHDPGGRAPRQRDRRKAGDHGERHGRNVALLPRHVRFRAAERSLHGGQGLHRRCGRPRYRAIPQEHGLAYQFQSVHGFLRVPGS